MFYYDGNDDPFEGGCLKCGKTPCECKEEEE